MSEPPSNTQEPVGRVVRIEGAAGELVVADGGVGGPAVLFVHGLGGDASHWSDQLAYFWRSRRAAALDLRGHGGSDPDSRGDYSLEALADDVGVIVDGLELDPVVLVGHSLGAAVVAAFAAERGDHVAGLVLVDPAGDQSRLPESELEAMLAALGEDPRSELRLAYGALLISARPETRELVMDTLGGTVREAFLPALASAARRSTVADLERYRGPKLALAGPVNDTPVALHRLVPDLPSLPFSEASHWLMLDQPDAVNLALDELLATL